MRVDSIVVLQYYMSHMCANESNIGRELKAYFAITGMPVLRLGKEAGVNSVILGRILHGLRKDMMSDSADRVREAMKRLNYDAAVKAGVR